jgi:hypothetical protein
MAAIRPSMSYQLRPPDLGLVSAPLALDMPDLDGPGAQGVNAAGFVADKVNLAMDIREYTNMVDKFPPYAKFVAIGLTAPA